MKEKATFIVGYFLPVIESLLLKDDSITIEELLEKIQPLNVFFAVMLHSDPDRSQAFIARLRNLVQKYNLLLSEDEADRFMDIYKQTKTNPSLNDELMTSLIANLEQTVLNRLFYYAFHSLDVERMKRIIQLGFDLQAEDMLTNTTALFASLTLPKSIFYFLVQQGAAINGVDRQGKSLLHHAAALGDLEIVKFLLIQGKGKLLAGSCEQIVWFDCVDAAGHLPADYAATDEIRELIEVAREQTENFFTKTQSLLMSLLMAECNEYFCGPTSVGYLISALYAMNFTNRTPSWSAVETVSQSVHRFWAREVRGEQSEEIMQTYLYSM